MSNLRTPSERTTTLQIGRRAFVSGGALFLVSEPARAGSGAADPAAITRFGLVTDLHHADRAPTGNRYYRETMTKIREAVAKFREVKADFAVELGDFIDEADSVQAEAGYLKAIDAEFRRFGGPCHHVLGNHCVWTLEKRQFLDVCGGKSSYYSFDTNGLHFVVLDACFRKDGVPYGARNFDWKDADVPAEERDWLRRDLESSRYKSIVFVHQRLDVAPPYGIFSGAETRQVLEQSGTVLAVFQGHHHRNDYKEINGIHYCTLAAMIEGSGEQSNAYCVVTANGSDLRVDGFRNQRSYVL